MSITGMCAAFSSNVVFQKLVWYFFIYLFIFFFKFLVDNVLLPRSDTIMTKIILTVWKEEAKEGLQPMITIHLATIQDYSSL